MAIRLKLKEALSNGGLTVYRLGEASGIPRNTLYNLVNQERERLDLDVLDRVMTGLEQLTGRRVELTELLERDDAAPSTQTANTKKSWRDFAGTFDDPDSPGDVAINHDKYLGEALMEEHLEGLAGKR